MKSKSFKTIRFVFSQARPYYKSMIAVLVFMLIYIGADFVHPFIYKRIINLVSESDPETVFPSVAVLLIIIASALFAHRIFRDAAGFFLGRMEVKTMARVGKLAFNYVTKLPYKFHASTFSGSTARKINRGVQKTEDVLDVFFWDLVPIALSMVIAVSIFFKTNLFVGLPLLVGLIAFVVVTLLMVRKQMEFGKVYNKKENIVSGAMIDSISNNLTVKTFTGELTELKLYGKRVNNWLKTAIKFNRFETWTSLAQGGMIAGLEIMSLVISAFLWKQGSFNVGDIVFVQANMGLLMHPMWMLGRFYRDFKRAEVDIEDLIRLLESPLIIKDNKNAKSLKIEKGEIKFDKVYFSYEKSNKPVLANLSLKIKPGEKIALVGPSGAGKSTFIKLLFRFVEPSHGRVLIDGQNIKKIILESLRQSISLVPQEPLLFHRTIYENIKYGKKGAFRQEILNAAKLAHADNFIQRFSKKYQTLVGERGVKLSGGERQRIALARVFLENAPILVLDEATSSLDSVSENLIQQALNNLMKARTTIVIAHRLSTIRKMDRIIVFGRGRIVEMGTHNELIEKSSLYAKLWKSQVEKFV